MFNITSVELLNATVMGYIEVFGKSHHGLGLEELVGDRGFVSVNDRTIYWNYKENGEYLYRDILKDWKLLYTSDFGTVCKEYLKLDYKKEGGFRASVWRKPGHVILTFTGTNDFADMVDDVEIAFDNDFNDQLSTAYMLFKYTKKYLMEEGDTLYITGHSLGGALAQFVYSCEAPNVKIKLCTFNPLGIGVHKGDYVLGKKEFKHQLFRYLVQVPNRDYVANKVWDYMYNGYKVEEKGELHPIEDKDTSIEFLLDILRKSFAKDKVEFGWLWIKGFFRFGVKKQVEKDDKYKADIPVHYIKYLCNMIYYFCMTSYRFQKNHLKVFYNTNGVNYYFKEDWVPSLQTKIGFNIQIDSGKIHYGNVDDSKFRVIKNSVTNFGFTRHGIGLFLLWLSKCGRLSSGSMRKEFLYNVYKEVMYNYIEKMRNLGRCDGIYSSIMGEDYYVISVREESFNRILSLPRDIILNQRVIIDKFSLDKEILSSIHMSDEVILKKEDDNKIVVGVNNNLNLYEISYNRKPIIVIKK